MSAAALPPIVWFGIDLSSTPDRTLLSCGCGAGATIVTANSLLAAARMVLAVRPTNWDDDEDPDQVAAWSALEEALRPLDGLLT